MVQRRVLQAVSLVVVVPVVWGALSAEVFGAENTLTGLTQEYTVECKDGKQPCPALGGVRVIEESLRKEDMSDEGKGGLYGLGVPESLPRYTLAYCRRGYITETRTGSNSGSIQKRDIVKMHKDTTVPKLADAEVQRLVTRQREFYGFAREVRLRREWVEIPRQNLMVIVQVVAPTAPEGSRRASIVTEARGTIERIAGELGPAQKTVCDQ